MSEPEKDLFKSRDDYYRSLGEAFDSFANAERELVFMLGELSSLKRDVANVLLSGLRAASAIDQTRRVYKVLNREVPAAVESALEQLKVISTDRNLIAHHGSIASAEHGMLSSNFRIVLPNAEMKDISVSPSQLGAMSLDLSCITLVFVDESRRGKSIGSTDADSVVQSAVEFAKARNWHYKTIKIVHT
ncbi:MAG: hypothetical protein R3B98_04795 [Hyphomonas sp.]